MHIDRRRLCEPLQEIPSCRVVIHWYVVWSRYLGIPLRYKLGSSIGPDGLPHRDLETQTEVELQ